MVVSFTAFQTENLQPMFMIESQVDLLCDNHSTANHNRRFECYYYVWIYGSGFRETLRSDIDVGRFQPPGQRNPNMNLVIVSHGLTLRVFLMRWYKWTVNQFEGLNNLGNGKPLIMEKGYGGRYLFLFFSSL